MSEKFVTKRPHKKSRAGCQTCKTRKIKCDEARPSCSFCTTRKISCNYTRTPRSTSQSSSDSNSLVVRAKSPQSDGGVEDASDVYDSGSSVPSAMPILSPMSSNDLRIMHHWSTFTWKSIGIGSSSMDAVFEWTLPNMAFENEFLMNGILGIASLHMQRMLPDPTQARKQTDLYRAKSLQSFREALTKMDPQSDSWEAALLMSLMLIILCSKDYTQDGELTVVTWLVLYRGLSTLMDLRPHPDVMVTKIAPVFQREITILQTPPVIPTILIDMVATIDVMDPDFHGLECYCKTLDTMAKLFASLREDGLSTPFFTRAISWPSWLDDEFLGFAKERRPRAMVILAYYLSFLKLFKGVWWVEGISDPEIDTISQWIGPKWQLYLDVPLQVRNTTDTLEIASLLLR